MNTHTASSVDPRAIPGAGPRAPVEVADSGFFGHPLLERLADASISEYLPAARTIETALGSAAGAIHPSVRAEFTLALFGTSVMTRLVTLPADVDFVLHVSLGFDRVPSSEEQQRSIIADAMPAIVTAMVDGVGRGQRGPALQFVNLNIFLPLTHPNFPGETKKYCCSWSREDICIGSTLASLGVITMREAFFRRGEATLTLAADIGGLRTLVDIRIDPLIAAAEGPRRITPAAHRTWAGKACTSMDAAAAAALVEQDVARSTPGYDHETSALRLRDQLAATRLNEGKPVKALKYAIQALAFGGQMACAMEFAPFLRSRGGVAAAIGARLSNLVASARRHWADKSKLSRSVIDLRERAITLLGGAGPPSAAPMDEEKLCSALREWESVVFAAPFGSKHWAAMAQVSSAFTGVADHGAVALLRSRGTALTSLPGLRATVSRIDDA